MIDQNAKQKILQADLANVVRKVKAGKPLAAQERKLILDSAAAVTAPGMIGTAELSTAVNLTDRWLRQLAADKILPTPTDGQWPERETLLALIRHYQSIGGPTDLVDARKLEVESRTTLNNLKIAKHHNEFVSYAEVEKCWAWLAEANRAIIQGADIPPRTKADLLANLAALPVDRYLTESQQTEPDKQP